MVVTSSVSRGDLVSLGPYALHAKLTGPSQAQSPSPTVIILTGLGESISSWSAVVRLLSSFTRVLSYDRAGIGKSLSATTPRSASTMALELQCLLKVLHVPPPYVLVSHSYGSIIAREFLALQPSTSSIAGMVFVEANSETSYLVRPENIIILLSVLSQGLDVAAVTDMSARHRLTPSEWADAVKAGGANRSAKEKAAAFEEFIEYEQSCAKLGAKNQLQKVALGSQPVSVIKGEGLREVQLILDAAEAKGNGTPEQRETVRKWIGMEVEEERLQRAHLRLSRNSRWRNAKLSGHDVHLTEPEMIVDEVKWVVGMGK